jgi:hypothetical protein
MSGRFRSGSSGRQWRSALTPTRSPRRYVKGKCQTGFLVASGVVAIFLAACEGTPQDPPERPGMTHGSLVREAPKGFVPSGFLVAEPGASTLAAVDVGAGASGIFCLIEVGENAARVWPGGPLRTAVSPIGA